MAIVNKMNGIPLFSNYQEAVIFGNKMGLQGVHKHFVGNKVVYMAGATHEQISAVMGKTTAEVKRYISEKTPTISITTTPTTPTTPSTPTPPMTGGGATGGGGGGGY